MSDVSVFVTTEVYDGFIDIESGLSVFGKSEVLSRTRVELEDKALREAFRRAGYALVPKEELFILIEGENVHGDDYYKAHDIICEIVESMIKATQEIDNE